MKLKYILITILIGIITYLPSLFGQFVWDDEDFVNQNTYVISHRYDKFFTSQAIEGRGKLSNYYRPIQMSAYSLVHQLVGFNPPVYHAINIIVHIAAALVLYYFLLTLTSLPLISYISSILFLIHPLQTEAVSYVSGLSDPLVALFGFLSLTFFIKSARHPLFLIVSLLAFILSLLSKEIGLAFFGILVLLAVLKKRPLTSLLPFFLSSVIYLLFHLQNINVLDMTKVWGSTPYANSISIRIATFIQNIFLYLGLFFFPKDLHMERDLTTQIQYSFLNPYTFFFILLLGIGIIYFWKKRKDDKNPLKLFALGGFFITLLPYSGIILINGIFYEHFLYIPIAFLSLFLVLTLQHTYKHVIASHSHGAAIFTKKSLLNISILIAIILILRSYLRQHDWIDPVRFYTHTLSYAPDSIRIRNGLGMAYSDSKQYDKALESFDDVIAREPHLPNSYHNKGNIYSALGKFTEAEVEYKKALSVDPSFTFSVFALYYLYQKSNQPEKLNNLKLSHPNTLDFKH